MEMKFENYRENLEKGWKNYLQVFVASLPDNQSIPVQQQKIIDDCFINIESGKMDSITFERVIYQLVVGLNEYMIVWKMISNIHMNQLFTRGPVFIYLVSLPDVKTCISEIIRLKNLILEPSYSIKVYDSEQTITIELTEMVEKSPASYLKYDTALCMILYLLKEVSHRKFDYETIFIPEDRNNFDLQIASKVTNAKIIHHNGPTLVKFPKSFMQFKNKPYDKDFSNQIKLLIDDLFTTLLTNLALSERVIKYLANIEKPASQTIKSTALYLGLSQATFRRNLANEKTSFKQIQNQVLEDIYLKALLTSDIKIDVLALKLGYSERSTFERYFNTKFGISPAKYRKLN